MGSAGAGSSQKEPGQPHITRFPSSQAAGIDPSSSGPALKQLASGQHVAINRFGGIRAISFDVGGTLIRPWPSVGHVYAEVAAQQGVLSGLTGAAQPTLQCRLGPARSASPYP